MSVDLSQFHQVFFEESFEGLDAMESSLMELNPESLDDETINTIFRAAHSIKGGSATFGFSVVADFTHVLETLLDEIRSHERAIRQEDIDLFLESVDCLRDLLEGLQAEEEPDPARSEELKKAFEAILATPAGEMVSAPDTQEVPATEESTAADAEASSTVASTGWQIEFWPHADVLRTGNEPLRIFRELEDLGSVTVTALTERLVPFSQLDPESCGLGFRVQVKTDAPQEKVEEAFEWVVDDAEITIVPLSADAAEAATGDQGWKIFFKPGADVLRTGNEPLRIFNQLADLGDFSAKVVSPPPAFGSLDPEQCHLAWDIVLKGDIEKAIIDEAFEWVVDEAELTIEPLAGDITASVDTEAPVDASATTPVVEKPEANSSPNVVSMESRTPAKAADAGKAAMPKAPKPKKQSSADTASIRVGIDKVDTLINMVGELVITQSMLGQLGNDFKMEYLPKLLKGLSQLEQNTRELQESVMRIRMLPISFAFSRFPRMVRDLSKRLNKKIELELLGEQTELDKTVMEKIGDPLVHLVRNAIDHGIESPEDRAAAGKSETGIITLDAYHQGGNVVIEITDDGKGLNRERILAKAMENGLVSERDGESMSDSQVFDLIFQPGFSTAAEVSDVSGRGVGMDVVRRNIQELNGSVEIKSKLGEGSQITIRLPLTLAILDGQLVSVGGQTFVFPLVSIVESLQASEGMVRRVAGGCDVFMLRDEYVPIIHLEDIFNIEETTSDLSECLFVVVEYEGEKVGIVVDDLQAQQQVVIKSLEQNYQPVEGVSGATILGDGTVALILDIPGLVKLAGIAHQLQNKVMHLAEAKPAVHSLG